MKAILTFILAVSGFTAQAAQFEDISKMSATAVQSVKYVWDKQTIKYGDNSQKQGYSFGVRIVSKKPSEKMVNTIKQVMYAKYTDYSRPDSVTVQELRLNGKDRSDNIDEAVNSAYANLETPDCGVAEDKAELAEAISLADENESIRLFIGTERNSFGNGQFFAIYDRENNEILIAGSTYSE